ncbi:MAG: barstar family protein [Rhodospirillaceae bacterium]
MRIIRLDVGECETPVDFFSALAKALESPKWHGMGVDAFIDSIVGGDINAVEPPYEIQVLNLARTPQAVRDKIEKLQTHVKEARADNLRREGVDVEVSLEIDS